MKAYDRTETVFPLILTSLLDELSGQFQAPSTLSSGKESTAGRLLIQFGRFEKKEIL